MKQEENKENNSEEIAFKKKILCKEEREQFWENCNLKKNEKKGRKRSILRKLCFLNKREKERDKTI